MAESSSSSSVSERPTTQTKTAQQEKEEHLHCSTMGVPKKPRKLLAEVCHLSVFHFLPFFLETMFNYLIKLKLRKIYLKIIIIPFM